MDSEKIRQKLIAAARAQPPSDAAPYRFEQRVMACLPARPGLDLTLLWIKALWRAAASCVALTLLLSLWALFFAAGPLNDNSTVDLESTVLAPVHSAAELW